MEYSFSAMLSKQQVQVRLKSGEIRIAYSFDITAASPSRVEPPEAANPLNPQSFATKIFERSFFGDRLAVRLGPIVQSHTYKTIRGRVNFKRRPYVFDLRETDCSIFIMPGEGLTVSSIENILVGRTTAAFILPRLSLATAGIVAAPTYIDPCWDGILQIYINNSTHHVYELKLGESVAICRFYEMPASETADELKSLFAKKSHHYGLNWANILDTEQDPQPLRKAPVKDLLNRRLRRIATVFVREYWGYVVGVGMVGIFCSILIGLGQFHEKLNRINEIDLAAERNKALAETLQAELKQLRVKQVTMGESSIMIPAKSAMESVEVVLERAYSPLLVARAKATQSEPLASLRTALSLDPRIPEHTLLRITAARTSADTNALPILVEWIVGSQ